MKHNTPMQRQYSELKQEAGKALLFFRLGDFYELFYQDAITASSILNITLTARGKGTENEMPMCGIPHHSAHGYIEKLCKEGYTIAMCEQTGGEEGKMMKRSIVRYITPGTKLDVHIGAHPQTLMSVYHIDGEYGICSLDPSTGKSTLTSVSTAIEARREIERGSVDEYVIVPENLDVLMEGIEKPITPFCFSSKNHHEVIINALGIEHIKLLHTQSQARIHCFSLVIQYVQHTHPQGTCAFQIPQQYTIEDYVLIDERTKQHLEIFRTERNNSKEGSLFHAINNTLTPMGMRQCIAWMNFPLRYGKELQERLDTIERYIQHPQARENIRIALKNIRDIERITQKIQMKTAQPKDLIQLRQSLEYYQELKTSLSEIVQ